MTSLGNKSNNKSVILYKHTGFVIKNYYELSQEIQKYTELHKKWTLRNSFATVHMSSSDFSRTIISSKILESYELNNSVKKGIVTKIYILRENASAAPFVGICIDITINNKLCKFYTTIYDNGKMTLQKNKELILYVEHHQKETLKDSYNKIIQVNFEVDLESYIAQND